MVRLALSALGLGIFSITSQPVAWAETSNLSTYGTPGLVELPTADTFRSDTLAFTTSGFGTSLRNTAAFQVFPRVYGTFRYAIVNDFNVKDLSLYDRSFDLHFQFLDETESSPAVAVGIRDILGTGTYSSEYIAATKQISNDLTATVGLGWGRLAGRNTFANPLSIFGDNFNTRPSQDIAARRANVGGQIESDVFFRGPSAIFGGLDWRYSENLSFQVEYSPDVYALELITNSEKSYSPVNVSLRYQFNDNFDVKAFVIGGEDVGAQFSLRFDPKAPLIVGGREPAPQPILPRSSLAAASWTNIGTGAIEAEVQARLAAEGIALEGFTLGDETVTLYIENLRWDQSAQAAGRTARVLANTLPASVETFELIFQKGGLPLSSVTTRRSDFENLQYDYDAAWKTFTRAEIRDSAGQGHAGVRFEYALRPYTALSLFDPQAPIRIDVGAEFDLTYRPLAGLSFDGTFRYPFAGNLGDTDRESDSVIQRVRSDSYLYASESQFEVNQLTARYAWHPAQDTFARVSAGYLENMYGGISAEALWAPINERYAFGAELNYVKQRNFDMLLGFQDYEVATGHVSAYYDLGNGFQSQLDLGRYLAGDWGGTLAIQREFNNGFKVGGYFTLTDVPFDDFGEGSFDKGLTIEVPLTWFTGQPSRRSFRQTLRPVFRDGGARVNVRDRLYPTVRNYRTSELSDGWGQYLR